MLIFIYQSPNVTLRPRVYRTLLTPPPQRERGHLREGCCFLRQRKPSYRGWLPLSKLVGAGWGHRQNTASNWTRDRDIGRPMGCFLREKTASRVANTEDPQNLPAEGVWRPVYPQNLPPEGVSGRLTLQICHRTESGGSLPSKSASRGSLEADDPPNLPPEGVCPQITLHC